MNDKKWNTYKCEKCGGLMKLEIEKVILSITFELNFGCPYCGAGQEYVWLVLRDDQRC